MRSLVVDVEIAANTIVAHELLDEVRRSGLTLSYRRSGAPEANSTERVIITLEVENADGDGVVVLMSMLKAIAEAEDAPMFEQFLKQHGWS